MEELFTTYSLGEIVAFLVVLAGTVKGFFAFWDWAVDKLRKVFKKESLQEQDKERVKQLETDVKNLTLNIAEIKTAIQLLTQSDKDDIKAWITEKHHYFCYEKRHIDDYSLDCIEKRYKHYKDEGGNSFIKDLMEDLRQLPKVSSFSDFERRN